MSYLSAVSSVLATAKVDHIVIPSEAVAYSPGKPGALAEQPSPLEHTRRMQEMSRQSGLAENAKALVYRGNGNVHVSAHKPNWATESAPIPADDSPLWHEGRPSLDLAGPVLATMQRDSYKCIARRDDGKSQMQNWSTERDGWSGVVRWVDLTDLQFRPT